MKFFKKSHDNFRIPHGHRYKILVIEDDPSLLEVLENLFQIADYDFQFYTDASDIKSLVYAHQPDVVLLDYLLPTSNGGNLCHQLKQNKETADVPVIIYSAVTKSLLPINEYRCDFFVEKPFDIYQLLDKINICIDKKAKTR